MIRLLALQVAAAAVRDFTRELAVRSNTAMKTKRNLIAAMLVGALSAPAFADTPAPITTPDKLQTRLGTLEFKDGAPSKETVEKVYDNLDFMHATEAFVNAFQGASTSALWKGFNDAGIPNNTVLIFSELMDSKSLFLTANADTIYFWSILDVTKGPIMVETPPLSLGVIDDMWFHWASDFGLPGPDRGEAICPTVVTTW